MERKKLQFFCPIDTISGGPQIVWITFRDVLYLNMVLNQKQKHNQGKIQIREADREVALHSTTFSRIVWSSATSSSPRMISGEGADAACIIPVSSSSLPLSSSSSPSSLSLSSSLCSSSSFSSLSLAGSASASASACTSGAVPVSVHDTDLHWLQLETGANGSAHFESSNLMGVWTNEFECAAGETNTEKRMYQKRN